MHWLVQILHSHRKIGSKIKWSSAWRRQKNRREASRQICKIKLRRSKSSDAWHEHEHHVGGGGAGKAQWGQRGQGLLHWAWWICAHTHTHTHAEEESSNAVTRIRLRNMRVRFFRRPFFFEPTLKQMRRKYVWIEIFSKKLYSPFVVLLLVKWEMLNLYLYFPMPYIRMHIFEFPLTSFVTHSLDLIEFHYSIYFKYKKFTYFWEI